MPKTTGWGATGEDSVLKRLPIERRDLRPDDVAVRVDYCGVCHTDLHSLDAHSGGCSCRATNSRAS